MATKTLADPIPYSNPLSPDNVIYKRDSTETTTQIQRVGTTSSKFHSVRATKTISEEALRQYLAVKGSPLVGYEKQILASPYYSTIIAICTIEEYSCSVNPHGTNNLWGLMANGHLKSYPTLGDGLTAIENFLAKAEDHGRTTIESFRGWYCYEASTPNHVCTNWETTVLKTKAEIENL